MRPEIWWIIAAAVLVLAVVYRLLGWRYLPPLDLPGPANSASPHGDGGAVRAGEPQDSDDEWADQLHEINQLGKFGDLTRPVAHQTYYEVEYLICQLGVPEWVPERWRAAA